MIKIGLTGNIAAGKSEVGKIIKNFNIPIISTDIIGHNLLENNENIKNLIIKEFANFDILTENKIDRKKLGKIVFSDINKKNKLEKIIHPAIIKECFNFFEKEKSHDFSVIEIPLLFECNFEYLFDKIILVYANDNIRFDRIKKRNNFDDQHIKNIMQSQLNQDIKKEKSDYIIFNENKTLKELKDDVEKIIKDLK